MAAGLRPPRVPHGPAVSNSALAPPKDILVYEQIAGQINALSNHEDKDFYREHVAALFNLSRTLRGDGNAEDK